MGKLKKYCTTIQPHRSPLTFNLQVINARLKPKKQFPHLHPKPLPVSATFLSLSESPSLLPTRTLFWIWEVLENEGRISHFRSREMEVLHNVGRMPDFPFYHQNTTPPYQKSTFFGNLLYLRNHLNKKATISGWILYPPVDKTGLVLKRIAK